MLHVPELPEGAARHNTTGQDHGLDKALDNELVRIAAPALENGEPVRAQIEIRNVNRTVGTILGHEVTKRYQGEGLPGRHDRPHLHGVGRAVVRRLRAARHHPAARGRRQRLRRQGSLRAVASWSGPTAPRRSTPSEQIIAGNVIGYGATSGEIYLRGQVGERFCVRNSGAAAVVEGVGDHGCEYMTGGRVVVLGPTGRNFAAGMSGGVAYVLDLDEGRVNQELVELAPVDGDAAEELEALVRRHLEETGSTVAEELLADWPAAVRRFTEVMPQRLQAGARSEGRGPRGGPRPRTRPPPR